MPVIRELVNVFTFKTDDKGLKDYQSKLSGAVSQAKKTLGIVGGILGASFAVEGVTKFVTGLASGVREAKRLSTQMSQIITPDLDSEVIMKGLYNLAQDTGQVYTEVAANFKDMAISAKEFGVNQELALQATTQITKSLEVGRASEEDAASTWNAINTAMKRGTLSARQFGELSQEAPIVIRTLGQALKMTTAEMRQLATDGELTTDVLIKGFARANEQLDKEFMEKPHSLGDAFNYVWNEMVRVGVQVWKLTSGVSRLAEGIIWLTKKVVAAGEVFVDWVGGAENALRLLQYVFFTAFGAGAVRLVISMIGYMRAFAVAVGLATWQFTLIAGAILLVAGAIEDIVGWVQGKDSLIGTLLGPYEEWKKSFDAVMEPFYELMRLVEPVAKGLWEIGKSVYYIIEAFARFVGGDFTGALQSWNKSGEAVKKAFEGFTLDNVLTAIGNVVKGVDNLGTTFFNFIENSLKGTVWEAPFKALRKIDEATNPIKLIGQAIDGIKNAFTWLSNLTFPTLEAALNRINGILEKMAEAARWVGRTLGITSDQPADVPAPGMAPTAIPTPKEQAEAIAREQKKQEPIGAEPTGPANENWIKRNVPTLLDLTGPAAVPAIPPGAIGNVQPSVSNEQTNNVPITNNVNVTVPAEFSQLEATINAQVTAATNRMAEDTARQLTRSMPGMEAAAG